MNKKKYCISGLLVFAVFLLFWGYLALRGPEISRTIASVDDGCESQIEIYKEFIPVSTCQLEKQIEEGTSFFPYSGVQITYFKHRKFHMDFEAYMRDIQKGRIEFSSFYQDEEAVTKCDVVLQQFGPFNITMGFNDCENEDGDAEPFDLLFVYKKTI